MGKDVLIIPGHLYQQDRYPRLNGKLLARGATLAPVTMRWGEPPAPRRWADDVLSQIGQPDTIVGHSFGGVTALLVAADLAGVNQAPDKLVLASHSSLFADDLEDGRVVRNIKDSFGEVPAELESLHVRPLLDAILSAPNSPQVIVMFGRGEIPTIKDRGRKTAELLGQDPVVVQNARHPLDSTYYSDAVTLAVFGPSK